MERTKVRRKEKQTESTTSEIVSAKLPTWKSTNAKRSRQMLAWHGGLSKRNKSNLQLKRKNKSRKMQTRKEEKKFGSKPEKEYDDYARNEGKKYAKVQMRILPVLRHPLSRTGWQRKGHWRKRLKLCQKLRKKRRNFLKRFNLVQGQGKFFKRKA